MGQGGDCCWAIATAVYSRTSDRSGMRRLWYSLGGGGLRPWTPLVNPKFAYLGRNFLIRPFIFRREKPLLMSSIQVNFGDILPETSKSSAFWDMGVDSRIKWLLLFSPNEVGELGRHQSMSP